MDARPRRGLRRAVAVATIGVSPSGGPLDADAHHDGVRRLSVPVFLGAWFVAGPLQPGWAVRAGTPASLLPHTATVVAEAPSPAAAPAPIVLPSTTSGEGTTQLRPLANGLARVVIQIESPDAQPLDIRVVLNGRQEGQGISMTDGSVV